MKEASSARWGFERAEGIGEERAKRWRAINLAVDPAVTRGMKRSKKSRWCDDGHGERLEIDVKEVPV
jgi:hypothetical protein